MRYFEEYKIGGQPVLVPDADVEVTMTDLDAGSAGRDESGYMHRVRVRKRVKTWAFQYFALTKEQWQYMEQLLSAEPTFSFTYPDTDGTEKTCTAYCATTGITYRNAKLGLYRNYKFTVIQC